MSRKEGTMDGFISFSIAVFILCGGVSLLIWALSTLK